MRLPIAFACVLALAVPALAEPAASPACKSSLDRAVAGTGITQARLKAVSNVKNTETCAAARSHFIEMVKARAITASCRTGAERVQELQKLDAAVEGINGVIAETCG